ncbi:uncharacterized protein LOC122265410 [Penaeus japonicus]|uniref:uncharacterized protein LOC122265410 n=1 Tax=Penaeus japonicus TaxID=27405 RepID=UPI001C7158BA|nr:uncharacterized protein LOC122265410 [Penaeus japonicus]
MRNGKVGSPVSSWCAGLKMTAIFMLLFLGHAVIAHVGEPADPFDAPEKVTEGPEELRYHGFNILGKDLDVKMSDPSERDIKHLAGSGYHEAPVLTLEQLKEKHKQKLEQLENKMNKKDEM